MPTTLVSIVLLGVSHPSASWRPTDGDASTSYEVSLSPGGSGHARKAADTLVPEFPLNGTQMAGRPYVSALHSAFHDHSRLMPQHLLDERLGESLLEKGEASTHQHLFHNTSLHHVPPSVGQQMRGVLDFFGYAFALHMDRQSWKKVYDKKKGLFMAEGLLSIKLLRFPVDPSKQPTHGRKFVQVDFQSKAAEGFIAHIKMKGWWDDQTLHFRGAAHTDGVNDDWLQHAMMPWREADMRFDENGCHVRFDWELDKGGVRDFFMGKDVLWGIFRLDNTPIGEDLTQIYQSMTYTRSVLSEMTIRMANCEAMGSIGEGNTTPSTFTCVMEQRPISLVNADLYREEPSAITYGNYGAGRGEWFTFMGTKGQLTLEFTKDQSGRMYNAVPKGSSCGPYNPCPWIVSEPYFVQFFDAYMVVSQQNRHAGKDGRPDYMFYPIFDDDKMDRSPDPHAAMGQGLERRNRTNDPIITSGFARAKGSVEGDVDVDEDEPPPPRKKPWPSGPTALMREPPPSRAGQPPRSSKDMKIMQRQEAKINELTDQVTSLKGDIKSLEAKVGKKTRGQKEVKVNPGETVMVTASMEDSDEYPTSQDDIGD